MRKDFVILGLVLIISAVFSYFKGYIENGIGLIMTTSGGYILATGLFYKYENQAPVSPRKSSLPFTKHYKY